MLVLLAAVDVTAWYDCLLVFFIVCLSFYGISTFVGYLMPNSFLYKKQFYFKQFSLA